MDAKIKYLYTKYLSKKYKNPYTYLSKPDAFLANKLKTQTEILQALKELTVFIDNTKMENELKSFPIRYLETKNNE